MLVSLSVSHKTAPLETLEKLSAASSAAVLAPAHPSIRGTVIVSTCNRFETYLDVAEADEFTSSAPAVIATLDRLAQSTGVAARDLRERIDVAHGGGVARHLFAVASGLESVAVGEEEIVGQVRRAIESSRHHRAVSPELERLFQRAIEASREARGLTGLSQTGRSLVRLALELALTRVADWATARILLAGTGSYAATTLAALRSLGADDIRVHSFSGRAARFAVGHGIPAIAPAAWEAELAQADVIITSTTTTGYALNAATLQRARDDARTPRPESQVLIDLGMPRTIEPAAADLPWVDLLDLETVRLHAPLEQLSSVARAHESVTAAARRFVTHSRRQDVSSTVVDVRGHVRGIVDDEIQRLRGAGRLTPDGERAMKHLGGVLMHRLTLHGQTLAASGEGDRWVAGVASVFGIEARPPGDRP